MVTVVKNPTGHKIIDQTIEATITEANNEAALVTYAYHGLGTGDYVYIVSDIDQYNGFWYVTVIDVNTFQLSEYAGADLVEYYQDADIEYYQTQDHTWNSIFLPIIYKLSNNRWPVNSVDTERTVSSFSDDNGFTSLILSGVLKADFEALEFVKIAGASDDDLNGVFQIVEKINTSEIVINLPYAAGNSFTGATVQYYYNNYQVKVKVYAGLPTSHPWQPKKPYVEVAELSFTPDDDGIVMFSIADYIKEKVAIKNNLLLYSLPLNLDAFTGFYISTGETYDESDGYSLATIEDEYTDDTFEGYAIAGKLPFQNTYSGDYADYIYTSGSPALWLTLMDRLIAVEDKYFDISFIKNSVGDFTLTIDKYVSDYLTTTETVSYTDQGVGVYRIPITADADYDSFCIRIDIDGQAGGTSAMVITALAGWTSVAGPDFSIILVTFLDPDYAWTPGATPNVNLPGNGLSAVARSEFYTVAYDFILGAEYTISVEYTRTVNVSVDNPRTARLSITDDDNENVFLEIQTSDPGANTISITFTATVNSKKIAFLHYDGSDVDIDITDVYGTVTTETIAGATVTEEICIGLLESCDALDGFIPDIRLTEDGDYRILE